MVDVAFGIQKLIIQFVMEGEVAGLQDVEDSVRKLFEYKRKKKYKRKKIYKRIYTYVYCMYVLLANRYLDCALLQRMLMTAMTAMMAMMATMMM